MNLDKLIDRSLDKSIRTVKGQMLGEDLFQIVCDEYDEEKYQIPYLLNQNSSYTFKELIEVVHGLGGLVIPAHIDRKSTGVLDYYDDLSLFDIDGIEIYKIERLEELYNKYPYLKKYKYLHSSDAHDIDLISEREYSIDLEDNSYDSFRKWLLGE